MLPRLGHHRFVGRDHEQNAVDPGRAGEHVADEAFVARHVHERDLHVAELRVHEAEVDRDAPGLLFRQPIGIDAGEGTNERTLPVIDVTSGTDDEGGHLRSSVFSLGYGLRTADYRACEKHRGRPVACSR